MRSNRIPRTVDPRGPSQVRKTRGAVFPRKLSVRFRRSRETVVQKMERSGPTAARLNWFLSISNCRTSGGLRPLQETGGAQRQRGVRRFDGDTPCRTRNRTPREYDAARRRDDGTGGERCEDSHADDCTDGRECREWHNQCTRAARRSRRTARDRVPAAQSPETRSKGLYRLHTSN